MKLVVQKLAIEYADVGAGKTLLLLHGWQDSLQSFDTLAASLCASYRVISLDLPGFGKSERPKEVWNLDNYISLVNGFVEKLGLDIYALAGHSFGGRIIIKGAGEKLLKTEKIILIGSAGIANRKTFRNYFFMVISKIGGLVTYIPPLIFWRESLRRKLYSYVGGDYLNAGILRGTFVKIIGEDLTESAKKISVPALLVWGVEDTETPLGDGQRLAKLIPNSKLEILSDCGHFVHQEKPKDVAELIQKFL